MADTYKKGTGVVISDSYKEQDTGCAILDI